jgi:energy-coupling factor transporter transmembrane protein EcfT
MAELTSIYFLPGNTLLHHLDTRVKLTLMILISLSTLRASASALAVLTFVFLLLAYLLRMRLMSILIELRFFLLLLAFVFTARMLSTPGNPLWAFGFISITQNGIQDGALVSWRLLLVVLMSIILLSTTQTSRIKEAVAWFLAPIPMIPEKKIATMMGLLVRFIPVIFHKYREVSLAQKARCSENIKNPATRFRKLAFPLIKQVFQDAENIADAMTARCYTENAIANPEKFKRQDWLGLGLGIIGCLVLTAL